MNTLTNQYNDAMRYGVHIRTVREGDYRFDYVVYEGKVLAMTKHNGAVTEIKTVTNK